VTLEGGTVPMLFIRSCKRVEASTKAYVSRKQAKAKTQMAADSRFTRPDWCEHRSHWINNEKWYENVWRM